MGMRQAGTVSRPGAKPGRWRLGSSAGKAVALAALVGATAPAFAYEKTGMLDAVTVAACLDIPDSRDVVGAALAGLGWQPVLPADLDDTVLEGLALYFASQHVFDAAPDIRLTSAWERARTNARGLTRLAPPPASPSYFTSPFERSMT